MKLAIVLVATTGCAQIFGLDTTTEMADGSVATPTVTAEISRISIGATVVTNPEDLTLGSDTLAFLVPDAAGSGGFTRVPATQGPIGTWTAQIASGNPAVDFTLNGQRQIWAFPTRDVKIADPRLEHANPTAADPTSSLAIGVTLPSPPAVGETFEVAEIGPWLGAGLAATDPLQQIVMTTAMTSIGGTGLANVIPSDVVLALRYLNGAELTGVFQAASFTETAGANPISGAMTVVTADQTYNATIDPTTQNTRFAAVRPADSTPAYSWTAIAAPDSTRNVLAGLQLNSAAIDTTMTTLAAGYGNPFASLGWSALFVYTASESRVATIGAMSLTLPQATSATTILVPDASMPTLDFPAALPQTISIDNQPLSTDGMTAMIDPTMPATISVVADTQNTILYAATLYELLAASPTTEQLQYVVAVLTNDPSTLELPSNVLVAGHTYTLQVTCYSDGFSGAATGDLVTSSPPFDSASTFSGVFTVANP
ncbi:MAG TPA: hypothetical protein VGL61_29190 [Kofleriaceae bacterium]|jgi:hypothetical protein